MESNFKTKYGGYDPNSPASFIVLSMMQSNFIDQSTKFASLVNDEIKNNSHHSSNGIKQAGFLVIRETAMPSVLIETGYLTNGDDRVFLNSKSGQNEVAEAIANGFSAYYGKKINRDPVVIDDPVIFEPRDTTTVIIPKRKKEKTPKEKPIDKEKEKEKTQPALDTDTPYYMVQLATSPNKLRQKEEKWKAVEKLEERQEDGIYKYFETNFKTFKEVNDRAKALREAGFEGAFVVRYVGKVRQK
jgi:N-acetylmuramoyl-L-alanine amidase